MKSVSSLLLCLLLATTQHQVKAHPGAVAEGRATCGVEYSTPDSAYVIPDIAEAWYIRRVSTCESPVFWTKFEVTASGTTATAQAEAAQQLYIAAISPEIDRFRDQLKFHGVLYGPGVGADATNGLSAIPSTLPPGITVRDDLGGAAYLAPPESLATCSFVDTNPVMKSFSDVIGGRCMEQYTFDINYDDSLVQGATVFNWWLYSFEHRTVEPGTYYLQTWLTPADDVTQVSPGKYELTLGPWIWYRYASQETLSQAQSQGTSCSCAYNELDYRERVLGRLGGVDAALFQSQLPGGSCAAASNPEPSMCYTIEKEPYRSEDSAIEWSGMFSLQANTTYEWSYFAYFQGAADGIYDYPDPGMFIYVVESADIESVAAQADSSLKAAVDLEPTVTRAAGDIVSIGDEIQYILFTNTSIASNTTVLFQPTADVSIAVFTQHVPSEFMAHVLRNQATGEYVFPTSMTLYSDEGGDTGANNSAGMVTAGVSVASALLGVAAAMAF
ncbi:unnamed protein product [Cylindrotheca closterium]|uniref:Uncharacterized protein n=1 Tax=Cylindrotheca closterium TaxID=2856 RepID=A0AAD2CMZ0_9STRA|nr:unnamed protein product [Cylindrotheca closterium]